MNFLSGDFSSRRFFIARFEKQEQTTRDFRTWAITATIIRLRTLVDADEQILFESIAPSLYKFSIVTPNDENE